VYEEFYHFSERPFSLLPDPQFLYLTRQHNMALAMLEYGLSSRAGFTVITGEIGAGKTTLMRALLEKENSEVTYGLLNNLHCTNVEDFLRWIGFAFALEFEGDGPVELYKEFVHFLIEEYAAGRRVVIIIDEAQQLNAELIEQLRMLSNINSGKHLLLQFVLIGQPELRATLQRPELVQFVQRVSVDYHLEGLSESDTKAYIQHRLGVVGGDVDLFSEEAMSDIAKASCGIPRVINVLCDTALFYGYTNRVECIDRSIVADVLADKQSSLTPIAALNSAEEDEDRPHEQEAPQSAS
jgi:type II secretory pathway predicted ATPase ExeA